MFDTRRLRNDVVNADPIGARKADKVTSSKAKNRNAWTRQRCTKYRGMVQTAPTKRGTVKGIRTALHRCYQSR